MGMPSDFAKGLQRPLALRRPARCGSTETNLAAPCSVGSIRTGMCFPPSCLSLFKVQRTRLRGPQGRRVRHTGELGSFQLRVLQKFGKRCEADSMTKLCRMAVCGAHWDSHVSAPSWCQRQRKRRCWCRRQGHGSRRAF